MAMREITKRTYVWDEHDDIRVSVEFDPSDLDQEKADKIRQVIEEALNGVSDVLGVGKG